MVSSELQEIYQECDFIEECKILLQISGFSRKHPFRNNSTAQLLMFPLIQLLMRLRTLYMYCKVC